MKQESITYKVEPIPSLRGLIQSKVIMIYYIGENKFKKIVLEKVFGFPFISPSERTYRRAMKWAINQITLIKKYNP